MSTVRERPSLFSGPMVRAILSGSKTQTRRALKQQPLDIIPMNGNKRGVEWVTLESRDPKPSGRVVRCRFGVPGDRLWVREAWRTVAEADATAPRNMDAAYRLWFEADAPHQPGAGLLRASMHMLRWASRITLEITKVRAQRLQDISEADAAAEGVDEWARVYCGEPDRLDALGKFELLWSSINGRASWDANPWVWAISFRRV